MSTLEKQLCAAARAGDLNAIVAALQAGARIDAAPARNRNPALIVAAEAGQADAISLLLERGAAPDVLSTGDNSNPLQKALAKNRAASVAALLKHEYYQHQATGGYLTCMVTFTTGTAVFQMLSDLQFALRPVTSDNQCPGWTPLHEAAYTANEMWVRELLERGLARAKCTDAHGRTPLHGIRPMRRPYPVHGSYIPMVAGTDANENATRAAAALIIHGADVESRANNGKPPTIVDDPTFSQRIQDAVRNRCTGVFPSADLKRLHPTALQRYIGPVFQTPKFVRGRRGPARPATVPRAELLALEAAVMGGDCSALGHLLPQVGNLDLRLSGKRTPLQLAAEKGRAEVVQQLIAAGANLEGAPLAGRTALHFAAANAHASTVEVLIQAGANPKAYDNMGYTPLMMTAMNPSGAEVAKVLMRGGASATAAMQPQKITPQNYKIAIQSGSYENKWTALHYAVIYGNVSVLAALLESGADPNAAEEVTKLTPMHVSCSDLEISLKKRENCGRVLLQHGADPTMKDSKGLTSLDFALKYGVTALLQEMQQAEKRLHSNEKVRKDPTEEMGDAVASGDEPLLAKLLEQMSRRDAGKYKSLHLLHRAAKCKNLEAATLLVQHGFAIEAVDEEGQTALHIAAETANHQMVEKLLELGAAVDARDNYQQTPLILASQGLSKLSVIALLKADADANALTRNGYSAIGFAVSTGGWQLKQKRTRDIVRLLLAAGADPEIGTVYGVPVMAEIRRYTREVMHRLYPGMEMDDRLISQQLAEAWDLEACLRYIEESSSRASS